MAKKALSLVKKQMPETKYYEKAILAYANYSPTLGTNTGLYSLSDVTKNTGIPNNTTRESDKIRLMGFHLKGQVQMDAANYPSNIMRIVIIQDYTNSFSDSSNLLNYSGSVGVVNSHYNFDWKNQSKRFKVLYDRSFKTVMQDGNAIPGASVIQRRNINIFRKLNCNTAFLTGSTLVLRNEIKMFVFADLSPASSANGFSFFGVNRLFFRED